MKSYLLKHRETDAYLKIIAGSERSLKSALSKLVLDKDDWELSGEAKIGSKKNTVKRS